eukprot:TRINITY_DN7476_c0_g1_i2.p1 TRINITY_DN7476_c0_g1~~TRINITY_DN7476_c0_g1_i2.p1  ORF type:complete len:592 (-),score=85.93 TRINITY_DN7476_c0_g1_i2:91-1866(-)
MKQTTGMKGAFVYYFVCPQKAKLKIYDEKKNNSLCTPGKIGDSVEDCLLKFVAVSGSNTTEVLPVNKTIIEQIASSVEKNKQTTQQTSNTEESKSAPQPYSNGGNASNSMKDSTDVNLTKTVLDIVNLTSPNVSKTQIEQESSQVASSSEVKISTEPNKSTAVDKTFKNEVNYTVSSEEDYYFMVVNCLPSAIEVSVNFTVMNPNGEHLSNGSIQHKMLYLICISCWSSLFFIWLARVIFNICKKIPIYSLQMILVVSGALWLSYSLVEWRFWELYSERGVPNELLRTISYSIQTFSNPLFVGLFMCIAKGFTIMKVSLTARDRCQIVSILLVYTVLLWLERYFMFYVLPFKAVLFVAILCFMTSDVRSNLSRLKSRRSRVVPERDATLFRRIQAKILLYYITGVLCFVYFAIQALVFVLTTILRADRPWLSALANQVMLILIYSSHSYFFNYRFSMFSEGAEDLELSSDEETDDAKPKNEEVVDVAHLYPLCEGAVVLENVNKNIIIALPYSSEEPKKEENQVQEEEAEKERKAVYVENVVEEECKVQENQQFEVIDFTKNPAEVERIRNEYEEAAFIAEMLQRYAPEDV